MTTEFFLNKGTKLKKDLISILFYLFQSFYAFNVLNADSINEGKSGVKVLLCCPGVPCSEADYKRWSPSDEHGNECLLGREVTFKRRAPHATCFNGEDFDRPVTISNCSCTRQDYEW